MSHYRENQVGWVVIIAVAVALALLSYSFLTHAGTKPMTIVSLLMVSGILIIVLALMYGMRTIVGDGKVVVSFGIGLINRSIDVNQIKSISIVKNPWYYGWGIRMLPDGWLYNISGADAVELQLKTGRVVRIGSRDTKRLAEAIDQFHRGTRRSHGVSQS